MKTNHSDPQKRPPAFPAWKRAEAYGIDMSLLEANLRLTIVERMRHHDIALRTLLSLCEAVKKRHATTG